MPQEKLIPVKYIFRRPRWVDRIYGTDLAFVNADGAAAGLDGQQVRMLPEPIALKFLRHTDTFERTEPIDVEVKKPEEQTADAVAAREAKEKAEREREHELFDLYDRINTMDKSTLVQFISDRYMVPLDDAKSIEEMRIEATVIIDRFGVN